MDIEKSYVVSYVISTSLYNINNYYDISHTKLRNFSVYPSLKDTICCKYLSLTLLMMAKYCPKHVELIL